MEHVSKFIHKTFNVLEKEQSSNFLPVKNDIPSFLENLIQIFSRKECFYKFNEYQQEISLKSMGKILFQEFVNFSGRLGIIPSHKRLAKACNCSISTVKRWNKKLYDLGLLKWELVKGYTNRYYLIVKGCFLSKITSNDYKNTNINKFDAINKKYVKKLINIDDYKGNEYHRSLCTGKQIDYYQQLDFFKKKFANKKMSNEKFNELFTDTIHRSVKAFAGHVSKFQKEPIQPVVTQEANSITIESHKDPIEENQPYVRSKAAEDFFEQFNNKFGISKKPPTS